MGELVNVGKNRLRIICDCGKYFHELFKGPDGEMKFESFLKNQPRTPEPQADSPEPAPAPAPKPKKSKDWNIFEDEEGD
jgi:hypothetical protein